MTWITPGKRYLTRDGRTAYVTREGTITAGGVSERALFGTIEGVEHEVAWSLNGFWADRVDNHPNDLTKPKKGFVTDVVDEVEDRSKKKSRRK